MKAEQARRLLGKTVYLNFRSQGGKHILDGVPLRVIEVKPRTVFLELPSGRGVWWRLGKILGYYEKADGPPAAGKRNTNGIPTEYQRNTNGIPTEGGKRDDRTRSEPKV